MARPKAKAKRFIRVSPVGTGSKITNGGPGTQTGTHRGDQCCSNGFTRFASMLAPAFIYIYKIKKYIHTYTYIHTHMCVYLYMYIYIHIYLIPTSSEKCNKILASLACSHCLPACIPQTKNASNKIMNFS